jgi:hypothetical protein
MATPTAEAWDIMVKNGLLKDLLSIPNLAIVQQLAYLDKEECMSREKEQGLIDLMFEIAIKAYGWNKTNPDVEMEDIAKWVRVAVRAQGINLSEPIGSSWGVIDRNRPYIKAGGDGDSIEIDSEQRPD